jgi:hypothetical protein
MLSQHNRVFQIANQPLRTSHHPTKGFQKVPKPRSFDDDHNASIRSQYLASRSAILLPLLTPRLCYACRRVGNIGGDEQNFARILTGEDPLV